MSKINVDPHDSNLETNSLNESMDLTSPPHKDTDTDSEQFNANKRKRKHAYIESSNENTEADTATAATETHNSETSNSEDTDIPSNDKKKQKFKCQQCGIVETSLHHLNVHYRNDHDPVRCKDCGKPFNTLSGLHKHSYTHQNRPYKCDKCRKAFPFFSQLKSHQVSHTDKLEYTCDAKDCGKQFKRKNEYERHLYLGLLMYMTK